MDKEILKSRHFRLKPNIWYFSFIVLILIVFAIQLFLYHRSQAWEKFNFGISVLGEEMDEELDNFRNALKIEQNDSICWTADLLDQIQKHVHQELIDETIDSQLEAFGYVRIQNLLSGRMIYDSAEKEKDNFAFNEWTDVEWGYRVIQTIHEGQPVWGIGYQGERINSHYYVGVVFPTISNHEFNTRMSHFRAIAHTIVGFVQRNAYDLYIDNKDYITEMLDARKALAYFYFVKRDSLVWSSSMLKTTQLFLPQKSFDKIFLADLKTKDGKTYRQYTHFYDMNPNVAYKVDVAVPTGYVLKSIYLGGIIIFGAALLLIFITYVGGRYLTLRALRPVDKVIHIVNEITSKNLSTRLPIPAVDDEIARLVITFNDLLDRLAATFSLHKTFIADSSHELRSPLSILKVEIDEALRHVSSESKAAKHLQEAQLEIGRMARIVDDLQWLSKSDAGQIQLDRKKIRLDDVLMNTLSRCQILAARKRIKLIIQKINIVEYMGDEELLIRALSNLVNNAIIYSDPGKQVDLSLAKNGNIVTFTVKDNGMGVPKECQERVFDRFFRLDSSRSRTSGGSGLGLSITKWIAELHGGNAHLSSVVGKGSKFSISLPL